MTEEEYAVISNRAGLALLDLNELIIVPPEAGEAIQMLFEAAISIGHDELNSLTPPAETDSPSQQQAEAAPETQT